MDAIGSDSSVTFVTAYMNIYPNNRLGARDMIWRFEQFTKIAQTGIQLCVFVDESSTELLDQFIGVYPNVRRMRVFKDIGDTWVYNQWRPYRNMHQAHPSKGLPKHRNAQKDTLEYMALMHTKMECITEAIKANPWNSTHFTWIDFNVAHIFKNMAACQNKLRAISANVWKKSFLAIPGCWSPLATPLTPEAVVSVTNCIHWRFCGGFFMGDKESMSQFCRLYYQHFPAFLAEYNRMTWEVNFWSWMESKIETWNPNWYAADHNDSILDVPTEWWSLCLAEDVGSYTSLVHECPDLGEGFYASSTCITPMKLDGGGGGGGCGYWMNTRYVNYRLAENGGYIFSDEGRKIVTRNVCSRLDAQMNPVEHFEMRNPEELVSRPCEFEGVEDIRLWTGVGADPVIYFMGTSVNFVPAVKGRILYGKYDVNRRALTDAVVVDPPTDTTCEKNWCPLPGGRVLYQWGDMSIGRVVMGADTASGATAALVVDTKQTSVPEGFGTYRGSTYFRESLDYPGHWIGLVHFSEHEWPRHYYHVLVLMDGETMRPVRRSQPFSFFRRNNIEFCIGMMETRDGNDGGQLHFWVSQYDREPVRVTVASKDIPLQRIVS